MLFTVRDATFSADTGAVDVRAGELVVAGAGGGAVGPVEACRTADGAVLTLQTDDTRRSTYTGTRF